MEAGKPVLEVFTEKIDNLVKWFKEGFPTPTTDSEGTVKINLPTGMVEVADQMHDKLKEVMKNPGGVGMVYMILLTMTKTMPELLSETKLKAVALMEDGDARVDAEREKHRLTAIEWVTNHATEACESYKDSLLSVPYGGISEIENEQRMSAVDDACISLDILLDAVLASQDVVFKLYRYLDMFRALARAALLVPPPKEE